jgi:hypothetical protein
MASCTIRYLLVMGLMLTLSGCARHYVDVPQDDPYGFFSGFWHGLILPLTICVNFFSWALSLIGISFLRDIEIIGRANTGFTYYLGFVGGVLAVGKSQDEK